MIERSQERVKSTGEVFTPNNLVNEMLDRLPQELFQDATKTFIDPACGDGNILVCVVQRKIANGSTALQALETTYGVELMEDNTQQCMLRLAMIAIANDPALDLDTILNVLDKNIIQHNTLDWDFATWQPKTKESCE